MAPRPDRGETSYKGSGRLMGRKALITGRDSGMGRAAAIAHARDGADVAIVYYPTEEPDAQQVIMSDYPFDSNDPSNDSRNYLANEVAIPVRLRTPAGILSFLSTVTVFGTPVEIELSELTLEAFCPADRETARALGIDA